jgi:hypothetical protein
LHEIKFDGWRIQLHKHGGSAALFTKNGHNHDPRTQAGVPPCVVTRFSPLPGAGSVGLKSLRQQFVSR